MSKIDFLNFTANFVVIFGNIVSYAIIARMILSWFTMGKAPGRISLFLISTTEPVIALARKIPHRIGMIDFAPVIALIAIDIFTRVVLALLNKLA